MELIVLQNGSEHHLRVSRRGHLFEVAVGDKTYLVDAASTNGSVRSLLIEGRQYEVAIHSRGGGRYLISGQQGLELVEVLDPLTFLAEQSHAKAAARGEHQVTAYMPGRVVRVLVEEGQAVRAGEGLVVLEAMKMENEIQAERDGVVRRVHVAAGQPVEGGDPLFDLE